MVHRYVSMLFMFCIVASYRGLVYLLQMKKQVHEVDANDKVRGCSK